MGLTWRRLGVLCLLAAVTAAPAIVMAPPAAADIFVRPSLPCDSGLALPPGTDPPWQPVADVFSTPINRTLNAAAPGVLANDRFEGLFALDRTNYRAFLWSPPVRGTLSFNSDGSFSYAANYIGQPFADMKDSFQYVAYAALGSLCSEPVTVDIALTDFAEQLPDLAPVGYSETYPLDGELDTSDPFEAPIVVTAIPGDLPYTVAAPGVLANDRDPYSDSPVNNLEAVLVSGPVWDGTETTAGTMTQWGAPSVDLPGNNGGFTFTPSDNGFGQARFQYKACYRYTTSVAKVCSGVVDSYFVVARTILARPDSISADDFVLYDSRSFLDPTGPYSEHLAANDFDNFPNKEYWQEYTEPAHGTISEKVWDAKIGAATQFYTPDDGFTGMDSFTYRRCALIRLTAHCSEWAPVQVGFPAGSGAGIVGVLPPSASTGSPFAALFSGPVMGAVPGDFSIRRVSDGQVLPVWSITCSLAGAPKLCNLDAYDRVEIAVTGAVVSEELYEVRIGMAPTSAITTVNGVPVVGEPRTARPSFGSSQAAPTITAPSTTVLATESVLGEGALVPFTVTATGVPDPTVTCAAGERTVSSGDRFAAGTHVVDCEAANGVGSPATASFTIEVEPAPKAAQVITFDPIADVSFAAGSVTVGASSDSGLPVSFDAVGDCTASGDVVTLLRAGMCDVTASQAGSAAFKAAEPVTESFAISAGVEVAPRTGQYSDLATLSATVSGAGPGVVTFGIDGSSVCAIPTVEGVATCNAPIGRPAGEYELVAVFVPVPPGGQPGRATSTFTVTPETSTVQYTGATLVAAGSDGTGVLDLKAAVGQQTDGSAGDLTRALVVFDVFRSTNATAVPDWTVPAASTTSAGVATAASPALPVGDYRVAVRLDGSVPRYFAGGGDSATATVFTAATGGGSSGVGTVVDPSTDDIPVAVSSRNRQGAFAYAVRNGRGSTTPQGQFAYSFRGADGNLYVITASSWSGGAATFTRTTAAFSGKASVSVLDSRGRRVPGLGGSGFTFRVDATDTARDSFALSVWSSGGALYHRVGSPDGQVALSAGRVRMTT